MAVDATGPEEEDPELSSQRAVTPSRRNQLFILASVFVILLLYTVKFVENEEVTAGRLKNFKVELKNQKAAKHDIPKELIKDAPSSDEINNFHDIPSEVLVPCDTRIQNIIDEFGGDLKDRNFLLTRAIDARDKLVRRLRVDYGDYFDAIFIDPKNNNRFRGYGPIDSTIDSLDRLKRKLQIKVLTVQEKMLQQEKVCKKKSEFLNQTPANAPIFESTNSTHYERYVWATGGHSSAAGTFVLF